MLFNVSAFAQTTTTTETATGTHGTVTKYEHGKTIVVRREKDENPISYVLGKTVHYVNKAGRKIDEALKLLPEEPLIISLQGTLYALMGKGEAALDCITKACASPKSFGHAHHTYYQIACILSITERPEPAFEWLDRSVSTGFACWPFFLKDPPAAIAA